jgi:glycosyltransferase involved in cell wall biosynthesis
MTFMRVLHLTAGSDAGGISRYIFDLCAAMQAAGHDVAVAGEPGAWHDRFAKAPWPWIDSPLKGGPLTLMRAARGLRKYLAGHPVDLLHCHYRRTTLVARRLQKTFPAPVLYTLHLSHIPLGGPWGWLSNFGDHVHAPSSEGRQWLIDEARVPAERITLIPHGIHAERFPVPDAAARQAARAKLALAQEHVVALYLGRLEDPKNESWLIDLAESSRQSLPALRVLLAGEGPNEGAVKAQIERRGLGDRVRMLGPREPLPLLHAADALLLPSAREGFSYACAEAMCAGVPVLRTRTSGTKELIVEGTTGRSVAIERQAFLRASVEFLSDKADLRRMGVSAAEHIRHNFTFDRQLARTLEMYQSLRM